MREKLPLRPSRLCHIYAFTIALHSFLLCTTTLPCSTDIPLTPNALFTLSIYSIRGLPLGLIPLTSDLVIFFTKRSSSILSTWPNHCNTPCSAHSANSYNSSSPLHFIIPHFIHLCYSTHTPQTLHLHYILSQFYNNLFTVHNTSRSLDIAYLNFQKAFDKVPHNKIMFKV